MEGMMQLLATAAAKAVKVEKAVTAMKVLAEAEKVADKCRKGTSSP